MSLIVPLGMASPLTASVVVTMMLAGGVAGAAQPESSEASFDLLEFVIEGNRLLPDLQIERAVYGWLGERKTIKDVEGARRSLEKSYHDAGYLTVVVDVPEQEVVGGIVRLRVVEAPVDRLKISGSKFYAHGRIREIATQLAAGSVPDFNEVQAQVARLNRSGDRRVTPVLRQGRVPGTVEAELKVEDRLPLHGGIELNDRRSPNTSRLRLAANLRYDNLWQRDHSLGVSLQITPQEPSESRALSASYAMPVGRDGVLALYAVATDSDVATVGGTSVIGNGTIFGARYVLPLRSFPGYTHSLTAGIDFKDFGETIALAGADSFNTPIRYRPLLLQYAGTLAGEGHETQFSIAANFALRELFGNDRAEFANKRYLADSGYIYVRGDVQHVRELPGGWSWSGRIDYQLTGQPLISNEQFAAGGAESVRGYLEAEALGDRGARLRLDLRKPRAMLGEEGAIGELHGLLFWEGAALRTISPLPGQSPRTTLASAGGGLRLRLWKQTLSALDIAWPLKDTVNVRSGRPRFGFRIAYEF